MIVVICIETVFLFSKVLLRMIIIVNSSITTLCTYTSHITHSTIQYPIHSHKGREKCCYYRKYNFFFPATHYLLFYSYYFSRFLKIPFLVLITILFFIMAVKTFGITSTTLLNLNRRMSNVMLPTDILSENRF